MLLYFTCVSLRLIQTIMFLHKSIKSTSLYCGGWSLLVFMLLRLLDQSLMIFQSLLQSRWLLSHWLSQSINFTIFPIACDFYVLPWPIYNIVINLTLRIVAPLLQIPEHQGHLVHIRVQLRDLCLDRGDHSLLDWVALGGCDFLSAVDLIDLALDLIIELVCCPKKLLQLLLCHCLNNY